MYSVPNRSFITYKPIIINKSKLYKYIYSPTFFDIMGTFPILTYVTFVRNINFVQK